MADPRPAASEPAPAASGAEVERLFRSEGPRLLRLLTRRYSREEAGDIVQEVFLRLTGAADRQTLTNPESYMKGIIWNLLRDRSKSFTRRIERTHAELQPDRHAAEEGDPHQLLVARQTLARYEAAVRTMKPKTREVFLRVRIDGESYGQIAEALGMSVSGIEKQMAKAAVHLKRALAKR
ncbi:RNA polymerase sigma factor [Caulobacter sp.]|uniref:RNA polymerase sigma factor n=1 Tax=Caulobacter sp. TaxID=78 RepID=UPI0031E3AFC7